MKPPNVKVKVVPMSAYQWVGAGVGGCAPVGTAARSHGSLRYQGQSTYACLSEVEVIERVPFTYIVKDRGQLLMS